MKPASIAGHLLELAVLVERGSGPADRLVTAFLRGRRYLGSRERRQLSDLIFGFIRHRRSVEALFEEFLRLHPEYRHCDEPPRRFVPLLLIHIALTQDAAGGPFYTEAELRPFWTVHFPDTGFPPLARWAVENRDFGFLNADPAVLLGVRQSFQDWMVEEWLGRWSGETEELLAALNRTAPVVLRVNTLKTDRSALAGRLVSEGIPSEHAEYPDSALVLHKRFAQNASGAFRDGWFEIQDIGSQIVSLAACPRPDSVVIDACAGAGGKSLHMASLMENRGRIIALDTDKHRLTELSRRIVRSGADIIEPMIRSGFPEQEYLETADIVLVDAPCSGSGTIRRNPMLKWKADTGDIRRFHTLQVGLLKEYARLVRPGGRLVYSTCSLFRGENEEVVEEFLSGEPGFRPAEIRLPAPSAGGKVPFAAEGHLLSLLPHRHGTDGFFIASMERPA